MSQWVIVVNNGSIRSFFPATTIYREDIKKDFYSHYPQLSGDVFFFYSEYDEAKLDIEKNKWR